MTAILHLKKQKMGLDFGKESGQYTIEGGLKVM